MENTIKLKGKLTKPFLSRFDSAGKKIYTAYLEVKRTSGVIDRIPIYWNEMLFSELDATFVEVIGDLQTRYRNAKMILYVWPQEMHSLSTEQYQNQVFMKGILCKKTPLRETPLSHVDIIDYLVAVNTPFNSFYFPTIAWNENAFLVSDLKIGSHLFIKGRLQSREYIKKFPDNSEKILTAYEVSTNTLEILP